MSGGAANEDVEGEERRACPRRRWWRRRERSFVRGAGTRGTDSGGRTAEKTKKDVAQGRRQRRREGGRWKE